MKKFSASPLGNSYISFANRTCTITNLDKISENPCETIDFDFTEEVVFCRSLFSSNFVVIVSKSSEDRFRITLFNVIEKSQDIQIVESADLINVLLNQSRIVLVFPRIVKIFSVRFALLAEISVKSNLTEKSVSLSNFNDSSSDIAPLCHFNRLAVVTDNNIFTVFDISDEGLTAGGRSPGAVLKIDPSNNIKKKCLFEQAFNHHKNSLQVLQLDYSGSFVVSSSSTNRRVMLQELPADFTQPIKEKKELRIADKNISGLFNFTRPPIIDLAFSPHSTCVIVTCEKQMYLFTKRKEEYERHEHVLPLPPASASASSVSASPSSPPSPSPSPSASPAGESVVQVVFRFPYAEDDLGNSGGGSSSGSGGGSGGGSGDGSNGSSGDENGVFYTFTESGHVSVHSVMDVFLRKDGK